MEFILSQGDDSKGIIVEGGLNEGEDPTDMADLAEDKQICPWIQLTLQK